MEKAITKTTILTVTVVAAILMLGTFGGGMPAGAMTSGGMMGSAGATGGFWIPALLLLVLLGVAFVAMIFEEE